MQEPQLILPYCYVCAVTVLIYMWKEGCLIIRMMKECLVRHMLTVIRLPKVPKVALFRS